MLVAQIVAGYSLSQLAIAVVIIAAVAALVFVALAFIIIMAIRIVSSM
jgi:hypothetical protein